jgi:hypothetical protein
VTADVCAGRGRGIVRGRPGFGVVSGRDRDIHLLVEMVQRTDPASFMACGTDATDEVQGVVRPVVAGDIGEHATGRRVAVTGGAIRGGQGGTGGVAGRARRADSADAVQVGAVAEGACSGQVACIAMGNGAAPWSGIRGRGRGVRRPDIMAVLATVDQGSDLRIETRGAAGCARERCCVASTAERQVSLGCGAVEGRVGKGDRMGRCSGDMAVDMADQAIGAGGRAAHPGNPSPFSRNENVVSVALAALVGGGVEGKPMAAAIDGNPAGRMPAGGAIQARGIVAGSPASPQEGRQEGDSRYFRELSCRVHRIPMEHGKQVEKIPN